MLTETYSSFIETKCSLKLFHLKNIFRNPFNGRTNYFLRIASSGYKLRLKTLQNNVTEKKVFFPRNNSNAFNKIKKKITGKKRPIILQKKHHKQVHKETKGAQIDVAIN